MESVTNALSPGPNWKIHDAVLTPIYIDNITLQPVSRSHGRTVRPMERRSGYVVPVAHPSYLTMHTILLQWLK